jgi:putative ABC transport system substrate-binding protein
MSHRLNRAISLTITLLLLNAACTRTSQPKEFKIEILLFGSHPLLLSVAEGIKAGASERQKSSGNNDMMTFTTNDANFQMAEVTQQTRQALLRNPAAIVALGTPSIKAALANRNDSVPLFFGAASDPKALGLTATNEPQDWQKPNAFAVRPNLFGIVSDFQYERMSRLIEKIAELTQKQSKIECTKVGYPLNEAESNSVLAIEKLDGLLADDKFCFKRAPVSSPTELPGAIRHLMSEQINMIQIGPDNTVAGGVGSILSITKGKGIPILASERETVRRGALAAYGVDFFELGKTLGTKLADKLLGNNTEEKPIVIFSKSRLYINRKTMEEFFSEEALKSVIQYLGITESERENVQ